MSTYLRVARKTIYQILKRWVEEGVRGLEDKSQHDAGHPYSGGPARSPGME